MPCPAHPDTIHTTIRETIRQARDRREPLSLAEYLQLRELIAALPTRPPFRKCHRRQPSQQ